MSSRGASEQVGPLQKSLKPGRKIDGLTESLPLLGVVLFISFSFLFLFFYLKQTKV